MLTINSIEKKIKLTKQYYDKILLFIRKKKINLIYIKTFNVNHKIKNYRQLFNQIVTKFINYINTFEIQFSIQFSNCVKYVNLLKILHSFFRNAIIC